MTWFSPIRKDGSKIRRINPQLKCNEHFSIFISVKIFIRGSISRIERWANGAHLQLRSYSSSIDEILLRCHWVSDLSSNALNLQWLRDNVYFADFLPGGTHTPRSALKKRFEECLFFCGNKGYPPLGKVVNIEALRFKSCYNYLYLILGKIFWAKSSK